MKAFWLGMFSLLGASAAQAQGLLPTPEQFFFGVQPQQRASRARPPEPVEPPQMTDAQKRARVVAFIKSATYCIIDIVNADDDALIAFKEDRFEPYVQSLVKRCPEQIAVLNERYDEVYGRGEGYEFIHGAYANDLGRAVLQRTKIKLQTRLADYLRRQQVAQAEADAKAARAFQEARAEEQRQREVAEREAEERRAALAKAEADRKTAEADREAAETKAAAQKREQIDVAKRTFGVLRDKFYECADGQLPGLVKSGEAADVLAGAAITICRQPLGQLQESALDEFSLEQGGRPTGLAQEAFDDRIKAVVRERVVADAVQAKAGIGMFAPK